MNAQHTPGRLHVVKVSHDLADIGSAEANQLVCTAFGFGIEHTEANANRIVRAWNSHDELVEALRELLDDADASGVTAFVAGKGFDKSIDKARAVLTGIGGAAPTYIFFGKLSRADARREVNILMRDGLAERVADGECNRSSVVVRHLRRLTDKGIQVWRAALAKAQGGAP